MEPTSIMRQSAPPAGGTQSQTFTETLAAPSSTSEAPPILRLRGAHPSTRRSVQWRDDVVDNEGLNRKKSKVCCIYHRPRAVDESSDSSDSSSSSSDSDSDSDFDGDRPPPPPPRDIPRPDQSPRGQDRDNNDPSQRDPASGADKPPADGATGNDSGGDGGSAHNDHDRGCSHTSHRHRHGPRGGGRGTPADGAGDEHRAKRQKRRPSPNAYEKMPRPKPQGDGKGRGGGEGGRGGLGPGGVTQS